MTLQVAERAVVGDDVEAVVDALERAARLVTTVAPLPHVRAQQRDAVVVAERAHLRQHLVVGEVRLRVADGGEELVLGLGVEVGEGDRGPRFGPLTCEDALHQVAGVVPGLGQVGAPRDAAVFAVDAGEEARDDLAQLLEHHRRVAARLGERVRAHAQQQRLVALAGAVDADVRQRRRGQDAADRVARLRLDASACRRSRSRPVPSGSARAPTSVICGQHLGVRGELRVHVGDVAPRVLARGEHVAVAVVPVPTVELLVVLDVARRLLEVRHEPTPLEDLGEQVRRLLAREVHATELRDGVVAVLEEHAVVELLGALAGRRWRRR